MSTNEQHELRPAAAGIATALGWRMVEKPNYPTIQLHATDESGHALYLRRDGDRIEIRPLWPTDASWREVHPYSSDPSCSSITVKATRPAGEIAREIDRRFLPSYRAVYAIVAARRDAHQAFAVETAATVARIKAETGARDYGTQQSDTDHSLLATDNYVHQFRVMGPCVRFEFFTVPAHVALIILAAARKPKDAKDE